VVATATYTPVQRPLYQDKLGKLVPEWYNQSGFKMRQEMEFWDAVASAGPQANNLHLATDR